jgi:hypothetical protein
MQSAAKSADRPANMNIWTCARYIYQRNGLLGFYRGVTPRIALGVYLTVSNWVNVHKQSMLTFKIGVHGIWWR